MKLHSLYLLIFTGNCISWKSQAAVCLGAFSILCKAGEASLPAHLNLSSKDKKQQQLHYGACIRKHTHTSSVWNPNLGTQNSFCRQFNLNFSNIFVFSFVFNRAYKMWDLCNTAYGFLLWTELTIWSRRSWCCAVLFVSLSRYIYKKLYHIYLMKCILYCIRQHYNTPPR